MSFYIWTMSLNIACCLTSVILILFSDSMDCAVLSKNETVVVFKNSDNIPKNNENNSSFNNSSSNNSSSNNIALEIIDSGVKSNKIKDYDNVLVEESRKKKQKNEGFMQKILPMMVMPFMVSTSMIPMMLISLKFMLLKSAVIGKIAIFLMLINMFTRRNNGGGFFTHNVNAGNDVAMEHYGWHGDEEYGAYINRRKRNVS